MNCDRLWMLMLIVPLTMGCLSEGSGPEESALTGVPGSESDSTLVVDASDFVGRLQWDHSITDANRLGVEWLFNNMGLYLGTRSQYVLEIDIPEDGRYHLYARTHGNSDSYFRIAVNDELSDSNVGDQPLHWKPNGTFNLDQGKTTVRLMQIQGGPVFDVLVLAKEEEFREEDLARYELHPDVSLIKSYEIPNASSVKFGDLTGDGNTDFLVLTRDYSAVAYNHEGEELWSWEAPEENRRLRAEFEAPGLVWDLDRDGAAEAIYWRYEDGTEWLAAADGSTGEIKYRTEWPTGPLPHVYNNFRLAVGNLDGGVPDNIIAFTDFGGQINVTAYTNELEQIWQHVENRSKDHLGHYVYPIDLTGDGKDEIAVGALLLGPDGEEIWNRFDLFYNNRDHVDSYRFADLNGNGRKELVAAHSEVGALTYDALDGEILWQNTAEHTQQLEIGNFLGGVEAPQIAVGARTYGNRQAGEHYLWSQVQWYTREGDLIGLWPEKPINGNPVFVKGDWDGKGGEELFWYRFKMLENGKGDLYFSEDVYHMFDFTGTGAEEIITLGPGLLRVYGHRNAEVTGDRRSAPEYLQHQVANHTHY